MGVYIKGMKMPKRCVECACYDRKTGDGVYTHGSDGCNALGMRFNEDVFYGANIHDPFEGIYKDCPLVPVKTPHGRLIDADALVDTVVFHTNISADTKEFIEDLIGIAPTVIEAEEG